MVVPSGGRAGWWWRPGVAASSWCQFRASFPPIQTADRGVSALRAACACVSAHQPSTLAHWAAAGSPVLTCSVLVKHVGGVAPRGRQAPGFASRRAAVGPPLPLRAARLCGKREHTRGTSRVTAGGTRQTSQTSVTDVRWSLAEGDKIETRTCGGGEEGPRPRRREEPKRHLVSECRRAPPTVGDT